MRFYPVNLDVRGRRCLVVGGGGVGTRKVRTLCDCGAAVTVVSPVVSETLAEMARSGNIVWHRRGYRGEDMADTFLVFCATDNGELNRQMAEDARQHNVLCNIADRPDDCDFTLPAVVAQGDLILTVSTSGKSPALSRKLRQSLASQYGPAYAEGLRLLGMIRERLLREGHAPDAHRRQFRTLLEQGFMEHIQTDNRPELDRLLAAIFGPDYTVDILTASESDT